MLHATNVDNTVLASDPAFLQSPIGVCLEQLRCKAMSAFEDNIRSQETIQKLQTEMSVYRRAYTDLETEHKHLRALKQEIDKQKEDLESQLKGHRIVVLLDGDGAIFNNELIVQGQPGGRIAAQKLRDAIIHHLTSTKGCHPYQLVVYVFLNKRGLTDTFGRVGLLTAKAKFEEFIMGFNQAAERFIMLDVGSTKEAADAKIKALLEDEIRLPQTERIIFGGCHDNGYATTLRSQITFGFKQKLILLRGYTDMAEAINELELPSFSIPELFIQQKLTTSQIDVAGTPTLPALVPPALFNDPDPCRSAIQEDFEALPFAFVEPEDSIAKKSLYSSYSLAVQTHPPPLKRASLDLGSGGNSSSSEEESEDGFQNCQSRRSSAAGRPRKINPNILLSKHKPPPCTLFYLSSCKHGTECKYAHDYILQPEHYLEIRVNAKKSPCPSKNKGEVCLWGDDCCYGHYCPSGSKCHFYKQGRCKFIGSDMHKETKAEVA